MNRSFDIFPSSSVRRLDRWHLLWYDMIELESAEPVPFKYTIIEVWVFMTVLLLVLTVLFSLQSLFCKLYSDHTSLRDHAVIPVVFAVWYGLFAALATLCLNAFRFAPSLQTVLFGLVNGVMLFLYNFSLIRAGEQGSYAFTQISALFGGVIVPTFASLIWSERLTTIQWIGTAITLVSFLVINADSLSLKNAKRSFFLWCLCLFTANGLYSVLMTAQQRAHDGAQRSEMIIVTFAFSAVVAFGYLLVMRGRRTFRCFRVGLRGGVFATMSCIIATAAANVYVYLLSRMNLSVMATVSNGGTLMLSILYSFLLFREKPAPLRLGGMALSLLGMVLLSL